MIFHTDRVSITLCSLYILDVLVVDHGYCDFFLQDKFYISCYLRIPNLQVMTIESLAGVCTLWMKSWPHAYFKQFSAKIVRTRWINILLEM